MRHEILKIKGRLAESKRKRNELSLEGKGLLAVIRNHLDPFEPDIVKLDIVSSVVCLSRLNEVQLRLRELDGQISELEDALG